jgi:hypothetical protein
MDTPAIRVAGKCEVELKNKLLQEIGQWNSTGRPTAQRR